MPDLSQSLQGRDLGHLKIIADLWGVELSAPDARVGLQRLVPALLNRRQACALVERLPGEARAALDDLLRNEGRLPWPLFTRRYGAVREMGPARRDRELPHLNPASPAEVLWYRGLTARAFFDTPTGPEEHAFIPEDLLELLPGPGGEAAAQPGRPATPLERAYLLPADDTVLDHACTLLAALRMGRPVDELPGLAGERAQGPQLRAGTLLALLGAAGLLGPDGLPAPEPARAFLEAPRGEALAVLVQAWLTSPDFDELRLLPGLACEGEWTHDPRRARQAVLDFLALIPGNPRRINAAPEEPAGLFWSLESLVRYIKSERPDFQRPAGDYDSWFIRETASGEFLRGFEAWDRVDGELVRFLICGPLHWLGIMDLAAPAPGAPPAAFRLSPWAARLLAGEAPAGLPPETEAAAASSDGRLRLPRLAPRSVRYQLARFSRWEGEKDGVYRYRLTPGSLETARQAGLRLSQLLALLRRHAGSVPPALARALERWEAHGREARLERQVVLRLSSPEILQALRSSRAARFLGDPLGPTAVIVKPGAVEKVLAALLELGYLGEFLEDQEAG